MTDTKFNVSSLLRELIGARRDHTFTEQRLPLDENTTLRQIEGSVRFTRTATGIFAHVRVTGLVRLECVRCLEELDYSIELDFADEFHSLVDVVTAVPLPQPQEEDPFFLTEQHMADIGEAIRAYTLLELPMGAICAACRDTPVSFSVESEGLQEMVQDEPVDERLAVLKAWSQQQEKP